MTCSPSRLNHIVRKLGVFLAVLGAGVAPGCWGDPTPRDLALSALGAKARSWEPGVMIVPEHEPSKVNDGSVHSYWAARAVTAGKHILCEKPLGLTIAQQRKWLVKLSEQV